MTVISGQARQWLRQRTLSNVGRLAVNPAADVSLPRVQAADKRFLNHRQVHELADACGKEYRLLVLFLAYTGLPWGEMAALRVGRVDFLRRRVLVSESVTPVKGVMTFGPTKGHERREVPLPRFLVGELAVHVAGRSPDELLFTGERRPSCGLRHSSAPH
jgi:integrase